jgi:ABC-type spermidine/putrescine transport system permease subunit II
MRSDGSPLFLRISALACIAFLHVPLLLIFLYAFTTEEKSFQFPPRDTPPNGSALSGEGRISGMLLAFQ